MIPVKLLNNAFPVKRNNNNPSLALKEEKNKQAETGVAPSSRSVKVKLSF